jgi:hypothetical protein
MATAEYYCRTWNFFEASGPDTARKAYPLGSTVTIGQQRNNGKFMLSWADRYDILHVLTGLTLDENGLLTAISTEDLATGTSWKITISANEDLERIAATVSSIDIEGNLTGAWGAEAPPHP